jgi:hypothetical protein
MCCQPGLSGGFQAKDGHVFGPGHFAVRDQHPRHAKDLVGGGDHGYESPRAAARRIIAQHIRKPFDVSGGQVEHGITEIQQQREQTLVTGAGARDKIQPVAERNVPGGDLQSVDRGDSRAGGKLAWVNANTVTNSAHWIPDVTVLHSLRPVRGVSPE